MKAKDHPDYAKFFRMAEVGGNIVDIRREMREFDLDDNLIQTPERQIPAETKLNVRNHLHQATAGSYLERVGEFDFHDDESDGMSSRASSSVTHSSTPHVNDKEFTDMFRRKPTVQTQPTVAEEPAEESPTPQRGKGRIVVHILKPLGITMGENVEDEEQGVHVASCTPNGNAAATGVIRPGMILLEACGEDVRHRDFDDIMDILRGAPADEKLTLVFAPAPGEEEEEEEASCPSDAEKSAVCDTAPDPSPPVAPPNVNPSPPSPRPVVTAAAISEALLKSDSDESEAEVSDEEPAVPTTSTSSAVPAAATVAPAVAAPVVAANVPPPMEKSTSPSPKATTSHVPVTASTGAKRSLIARKGAAAMAARSAAATAIPEPPATRNTPPTSPKTRTSATSPATSATADADDDSSGDNWGKTHLSLDIGAVGVPASGGVFGLPDHLSVEEKSTDKAESKSEMNPISRSRHKSPSRHLHGEDPEWAHQDKVEAITSPMTSPTPTQTDSHMEESPVLESAALTSRPRGPRMALLRGKGGPEESDRRATRGGIARVAAPSQTAPVPTSLLDKPASSYQSHSQVQNPDPARKQDPVPHAGVFGAGTGYFDESDDDEDAPPPVLPLTTNDSTPTAFAEPTAAISQSSPSIVATQSSMQTSTTAPRKAGSSRLGDQLKILRSMKRAGTSVGSAASTASSAQPSVEAHVQNSDEKEGRWHGEGDTASVKSNGTVLSDLTRRSRLTAASGRGAGVPGPERLGERSAHRPASPTASIDSSVVRGNRGAMQREGNDGRRGVESGASTPSTSLHSRNTLYGHATSSSPDMKQQTGGGGGSGGFSPNVTHKQLSSFDISTVSSAPQLGSRSSASMYKGAGRVGGATVPMQDRGVQSDYSSYVDEKYINSYQMLLGERQEIEQMREALQQETEERAAMLLAEEDEAMRRIAENEEESMSRLRAEENVLRDRVREVEDIILMERNEIDRQWKELRAAEADSERTIRLRTKELLEIMHVVRAHHDKLQHDKKRIARQRLHLDMALHDLNRFNSFGGGGGGGGSVSGMKMQHKRPSTPTSTRRWASPHVSGSSRGWAGTDGGTSVASERHATGRRLGSPTKERPFHFGSSNSSRSGR